jgi:hypothetical protein
MVQAHGQCVSCHITLSLAKTEDFPNPDIWNFPFTIKTAGEYYQIKKRFVKYKFGILSYMSGYSFFGPAHPCLKTRQNRRQRGRFFFRAPACFPLRRGCDSNAALMPAISFFIYQKKNF